MNFSIDQFRLSSEHVLMKGDRLDDRMFSIKTFILILSSTALVANIFRLLFCHINI